MYPNIKYNLRVSTGLVFKTRYISYLDQREAFREASKRRNNILQRLLVAIFVADLSLTGANTIEGNEYSSKAVHHRKQYATMRERYNVIHSTRSIATHRHRRAVYPTGCAVISGDVFTVLTQGGAGRSCST